MAYQDQISSVSLISEHIRESIDQAISVLEDYHNGTASRDARKSAWSTIYQLNRVFTFVELPAAAVLTRDLCNLIKTLPDTFDQQQQNLLEAIIYSLSILSRYIDFICSKPFDLPQLLFSTINELRSVARLAPFAESTFFKADHLKVRPNVSTEPKLDKYDMARVSRRLRQMYQMGLIEVIRKTNIHGGLSMMARALKKLEQQCGSPMAPNLWWIALGAVEGFQNGGLILTSARIKLFARLDLQIRELGRSDGQLNYKNRAKAENLAFELLYLVSLSDASDPLTQQLRQHFALGATGLTERNLTQEFLLLKGLNDEDYASLFDTILETVLKIQTDLIAEEFEAKSPQLQQLYKEFKQLLSLFSVLEYPELQQQLTSAVEQIAEVIKKKQALPDPVRQICSDCLSQIETQLNEYKKGSKARQTALSRQLLTPAQVGACNNARKQIQQLFKQIESYSKQEHDPELLLSLPASLQRALNEMAILKQPDLSQLTRELITLGEDYFVKQPATLKALELLADILCSIEFFLETLENQHTPSPKILTFADENLAKLKQHIQL
jgi:hypothetical protein